jgi:hypothetical protein
MPRRKTMATKTKKAPPAYNSIAATDDVHKKLEMWRRHLSDRDDRRWTFSQVIDWLLDNMGPPEEKVELVFAEKVTFDPEDPSTYPSVCNTPEDVADRFGYKGGERLLFSRRGAFLGRIIDAFPEETDGNSE